MSLLGPRLGLRYTPPYREDGLLIHLPSLRHRKEVLPVIIMLIITEARWLIAEPYWLKPGSYAIYVFDSAYLTSGIRTENGSYRWYCLSVKGGLAILNVSFQANAIVREIVEGGVSETRVVIRNSTIVTINITSRALIDENGNIWGYAHFWIDPIREPWSGEGDAPEGDITLINNYFNNTVSKARVDRMVKHSAHGLSPLETPFGKFDETATMWTLFEKPLRIAGFFMTGQIFQFLYESKLGLLVGGTYMDDILCNKFGVVTFFEKKPKQGMPPMELKLAETNLEAGVLKEENNSGLIESAISFIRNNAILIAVLLFILPLLFVILKGRIHER